MREPAAKERIPKAVEELSDDVTLDEVIEKLCFLTKVERGLQQTNAGMYLRERPRRTAITAPPTPRTQNLRLGSLDSLANPASDLARLVHPTYRHR